MLPAVDAALHRAVETSLTAAWRGAVRLGRDDGDGIEGKPYVRRLHVESAPADTPLSVVVKRPRLADGETFDAHQLVAHQHSSRSRRTPLPPNEPVRMDGPPLRNGFDRYYAALTMSGCPTRPFVGRPRPSPRRQDGHRTLVARSLHRLRGTATAASSSRWPPDPLGSWVEHGELRIDRRDDI